MERVTWITEGLTTAAPGIAGVTLFVAYGVVLALLLGLRNPLLLLVAAVPVGISLVAVSAQLLGMFGLTTSLVTAALVALLAAAAIGGSRLAWLRRSNEPRPVPPRTPGLVWAGGAFGAVISAAVWIGGIGSFVIPPQSNDDIWHGYLIERLTYMPTVTASTVAPAFVDTAQPIVPYPYGFHLAAALVHSTTGVGVAETINGAWVILGGAMFALGIAAVAWRLFPDHPWAPFWSGVFAAGIIPYVNTGIMPYSMAVALVPGLLALLLAYLDRSFSVPTVALSIAAAGVFVVHPAAAVAAAVIGALMIVEVLIRMRGGELVSAVQRLGLAALLAAILCAPWLLSTGSVDIGGAAPNAQVGSLIEAGRMLVTLSSPWTPAQPVLAALTLVGLVSTLVIRRGIALAVAYFIFAVLVVGVLAGLVPIVGLTTPWYGQWYRLIAVVAMIVPVLAGVGVTCLIALCQRVARRMVPSRSSVVLPAILIVVGGFAIAATAYDSARGQSAVRTAWHHGLVTSSDMELFRVLADHTTPADKVLNSPRDGSTWMYASYGVAPVLPYAASSTLSVSEILSGAGSYSDPVAACAAVKQLGVTFAIVKAQRGDDADQPFDVGGFVDRHPDLFEMVAQTETGSVYKVDLPKLESCAAG